MGGPPQLQMKSRRRVITQDGILYSWQANLNTFKMVNSIVGGHLLRKQNVSVALAYRMQVQNRALEFKIPTENRRNDDRNKCKQWQQSTHLP